MADMWTPVTPFARFGVGWAGSYVMTRAFARWLPGEPKVQLVADVTNRLDLLATGELDLTWAFPMARVEWAYQGHRPWPNSPWSGEGLSNLRLVARIPRADCELIAIAPWSPVKSLAEIAENKRVRICLRTDEIYEWESAIFQQYGYTLGDIEQGGGRYWHIAVNAHEIEKHVADQTVDIVIGHAAYTAPWRVVAAAGFRFTPLDLPVVEALEQVGFTRHIVQPGTQPGIEESYLTLELADQPIVSRAEVRDDVIYEIAKSIDLHKKAMTEASQGQVNEISRQWETKLVPLHPGAERYYREAGYLK
jgi:TRAP-type uncharacterized transport system substrate-binding protein